MKVLKMKKYLNISEAAEFLGIKEHLIRYWDSIDPKTNKLRVEGISTKSQGGTRYFNRENLSKLERLRDLLYENGSQNNTLTIAEKYLSSNKNSRNTNIYNKKDNITDIDNKSKKDEKIRKILKNIRNLLN